MKESTHSSDSVSVSNVPLVVDLDGTLIGSDTLWESILVLLRKKLSRVVYLPFWILRGKSYFKYRIAELVLPDAERLPYNQEVLDFVVAAQSSGRQVILATAATEKVAHTVASYIGGFEAVLASSEDINLKGALKLTAIRKYPSTKKGFEYIGDDQIDQIIWEAAAIN